MSILSSIPSLGPVRRTNNEIPIERYISPKEKQKIIDELKLT